MFYFAHIFLTCKFTYLDMTTIYYEYERILGVNATYDDCHGVRHYPYFSSLILFNQWVSYEMNNSETVEITDSNYKQLASKGLI